MDKSTNDKRKHTYIHTYIYIYIYKLDFTEIKNLHVSEANIKKVKSYLTEWEKVSQFIYLRRVLCLEDIKNTFNLLSKKSRFTIFVYFMRLLDMDMSLSKPGVGDGQGGLVCCSPWGCKELDMTECLHWTELNIFPYFTEKKRKLGGVLKKSQLEAN